MKHKFIHIICFTLLVAGLTACTSGNKKLRARYTFNNILDIAYTPDTLHRCYGWFTDAGSWMGFTLPEKAQWVNGFCGPFSLDMFRRQWMAQSAVTVDFAGTLLPASFPTLPAIFPASSICPPTPMQGASRNDLTLQTPQPPSCA